jgi:hypothetical protein
MRSKENILEKLFKKRSELLLKGDDITEISEMISIKEQEYLDYINEDTATGGPSGAVSSANVGYGGGGVAYSNTSIGGMGPVVAPQASTNVGVTTEPGYSSGGGVVGSGDISMPYNPGGRKKVFQKIPSDNRKGDSKRRRNKMIQGLKNIFSMKQDYTAGQSQVKKPKIMNFDSFAKDDLMKAKKVKDI